VAGRWFSPGTPVSSTNKTHHHDIAEILLKVALNTLTPHFVIATYSFKPFIGGHSFIAVLICVHLDFNGPKYQYLIKHKNICYIAVLLSKKGHGYKGT
jgi:hypothetical protein